MPICLSVDRTVVTEDGSDEDADGPAVEAKLQVTVMTSSQAASERRREAPTARGRSGDAHDQRPLQDRQLAAAHHRRWRRRHTPHFFNQELTMNFAITSMTYMVDLMDVIGTGATVSFCVRRPPMQESLRKPLVGTAIIVIPALRTVKVMMASCDNVVRDLRRGPGTVTLVVMSVLTHLIVLILLRLGVEVIVVWVVSEWGRGSTPTRNRTYVLSMNIILFPARADLPVRLQAVPSDCGMRRHRGARMKELDAEPSPSDTLRSQLMRPLTYRG